MQLSLHGCTAAAPRLYRHKFTAVQGRLRGCTGTDERKRSRFADGSIRQYISNIAPNGAGYINDGCSPSKRNKNLVKALKGRNPSDMGQSLVKNYLHLVFSTKHRAPLIYPPYNLELYSYLGGICNNLESQVLSVGGYTDHVHILCLLSKKIALAKLLEELKSHSSKWMKAKDPLLIRFYWQDGYGAFSVNPAEVDTVISYIDNQREHHRKKTFQQEYRAILKKYKVEYDERYVWD